MSKTSVKARLHLFRTPVSCSVRIAKYMLAATTLLALGVLGGQGVSALTYQGGANIGFTIHDSINISISGNIVIPELFPGSSADSNVVDISVNTNSVEGYVLSAKMNTTSKDLTRSGTSSKFSGISSSVSTLSENTWGYKFSTNGTSWGNFDGLPISTSDAKVLLDASSSDPTTTHFKIGARASATQPSGAYTNTITFYAVAKESPEPAPSLCGSTPTMQNIANLGALFGTTGAQVQLCDERDGKTYYASKLADGKIWMTQNLDLELDSSVALTNELTDLNSKASWTPNRSTQDHQYKTASGTIDSDGVWNGNYNTVDHSYRPASDPAAGTSGDYGNDGDTYYAPAYMKNGTTMASYKTEAECIADNNSQSDCQHWSVGTFYSWYAATAGTGNATVSTVTNVPDSICPKGWHLPTSTSTGEFQALVTAGGITGSNITQAPYYFLRAGNYLGTYGAVYDTGNDGLYWSSTSASDTIRAYYLYFTSSGVDPSIRSVRYLGMGVRCVAGS